MAIPLPVRLPYRDVGYVAALGLDLDQTVGLFLLGALAFGVLAVTGLVVPALGLLALVSGALAYELVWTPATGFGELGGHTVIGIDADPHLWRYVRTWFVWAPILLAGGVAEFGI